MEADEPSSYSRREKKLSLQYAIRIAANPSNPAYEVTFQPKYVDLYEHKPYANMNKSALPISVRPRFWWNFISRKKHYMMRNA